MTMIEGVGDEVMQFGAAVLVLFVAALAWWSTNSRTDRYRTVVVMTSRPHQPVSVSIRRNSSMISNNQTNGSVQASTSQSLGVGISNSFEGNITETVIPLQEMDSIVDADMAMLDNNRLHFYRRMDSPNNNQNTPESTSDESEVQDDIEPASNAQIREMDSIVSAMEADVTTSCDLFTRSTESNSTSANDLKTVNRDEKNGASTANLATTDDIVSETQTGEQSTTGASARRILIKLKYLNDTLKEVEGSLDELLKDFKRRHFSAELSSECRVRLIFNGRLLGDEAATLRALGLHDRAVVHCLVHPRRPGSTQAGAGVERTARRPAVPERTWDLENILMTLVSVALTVVWFFRCEYSNMFTASASVALFGLTVFYSVAIFGLYLSETFQFDRRPVQPVPTD